MKLEDVFKERSYIHLSLVIDKRANEKSIARIKKSCKSEKSEYLKGYLEGELDVFMMQNKEIKKRIKNEMEVI